MRRVCVYVCASAIALPHNLVAWEETDQTDAGSEHRRLHKCANIVSVSATCKIYYK